MNLRVFCARIVFSFFVSMRKKSFISLNKKHATYFLNKCFLSKQLAGGRG